MDKSESDLVLAQLKSPGRVRRWIGLGARLEDLFRLLSEIVELGQWCSTFGSLGREYRRAAEDTDVLPAKVSNYFLAALYLHLGLLGTYEDNDERKVAYRAVVDVYNQVRSLLRIPVERVEYKVSGLIHSAYFRHPLGEGPAPCVLLLRGLDAAREIELHTISDFLVERGFATFAVDLEGQGESRFAGRKLTPAVGPSIGPAIDYLMTRKDVDQARLAILGQSFAGHLAIRAAASDPRIRACVSLGSFYSLKDFEVAGMLKHNCMLNMKVSEEEWPSARGAFTLDGVIENVRNPLLAINGSEDVVIPFQQTVKMHEKAVGPCDLKIYDGAPHCVYFDNKTVLLDIADWLNEWL